MRIAVKIAYDGSKFHGFAMQPDRRTVEGEIISTLVKSGIIEGRKESKFQYASRTDRGVNALGNVISFNSRGNFLRVMERMKDVWVVGYAEVEESFNPRHSIAKTYRYYLYNRDYDVENMEKAVKLFIGEHDFSSFARLDSRNPVRRIYSASMEEKGEMLIFNFRGKSFLWNQVRKMMGAIMMVGEGKINFEDIKFSLKFKKHISFPPAPPENLTLVDVEYEGVKFIHVVPIKLMEKAFFFMDALQIQRNA